MMPRTQQSVVLWVLLLLVACTNRYQTAWQPVDEIQADDAFGESAAEFRFSGHCCDPPVLFWTCRVISSTKGTALIVGRLDENEVERIAKIVVSCTEAEEFPAEDVTPSGDREADEYLARLRAGMLSMPDSCSCEFLDADGRGFSVSGGEFQGAEAQKKDRLKIVAIVLLLVAAVVVPLVQLRRRFLSP
jgi:hypothetical protein